MALATFGAIQRFQPFIAEHKHGKGIDEQPSFLGRDAAQYELLRLKQMQVVLLAVPLNLLVWMRRTEQLTLLGSTSAMRWGYKSVRVLSQVESSGSLIVMATADQKIYYKMFLKQDPHKNASADRFSKPSSSFLPPSWSRWMH